MTHADALNKILSNACPSNTLLDGTKVFEIDLCCSTATINARSIEGSWNDIDGYGTYEIVSVEIRRGS